MRMGSCLRQLLLVVLCAPACSSNAVPQQDASEPPGDAAAQQLDTLSVQSEVQGDVAGAPLGAIVETLYALSVIDDTNGKTALLDIRLSTEPDRCQPNDYKTQQDYAAASLVLATKQSTTVAPGSYPVIAGGATSSSSYATASVGRYKVGGTGSTSYPATSGSVELIRYDSGGIQGTFSLQLAGDNAVTGTFASGTYCEHFEIPPEGP